MEVGGGLAWREENRLLWARFAEVDAIVCEQGHGAVLAVRLGEPKTERVFGKGVHEA